MEHGFQVIDNSITAAHTVDDDDDDRTSGCRQMAHHGQMGPVAVHGQQLLEAPQIAALLEALQRFTAPVGFQLAIDLGKAAGQGESRMIGNVGQAISAWSLL